MYIEKRWLVPFALCLLLLSALAAVVLLAVGSRLPSGSLNPAEIASAGAQPDAPDAPCILPAAEPVPAAEPAPSAEVVPAALVAPRTDRSVGTSSPEEVVNIATLASDRTQINTRGFGDIGMQFQDVNINAPITNVHISNQGNNNSTNVNIGENDRIVSDQEQLQSNRSDEAPSPAADSTASETPGPATVQPVAVQPVAVPGAGIQPDQAPPPAS